MIRSVNPRAQFSFRSRRMGASPVSAISGSSVVGAAVSLAAAGVSDWLNSIQLSHDADTATTEIANQFATQMANLDSAYLNTPNPTCADQRAALDAFDQAWAWVQSPSGCGNGAYGSAGNACISERAPGGKYDATAANRDPIANDPRVASLGCDTSQQLLLPSGTSGFVATGTTAAGGNATTGQTAAQLAAAAVTAAATVPVTTAAATPASTLTSTIIAGVPDLYVYGAAGLLLFLMVKK
jgi:hypothetical protein